MVCRLSLPEGTRGMDQSRGLGLFDTTLSVLVLQKSLSNPELGAGMGRGLCLAGQWVLIPHASTFLREVLHFLTSPRPALGCPGQTPGLGTGAHRRGEPVGCNKPGWTRLIPPGWECPSCRREGKKWRKFKLLSRGKINMEGKMLQRSECPLASARLGRRHTATAVGRCWTSRMWHCQSWEALRPE